jgi:hypothetical protein
VPLVMLKSDPRARLKPCLRCGYSLKHITDSRNCPECGLAIWISLSGNDDLEMSRPEWLRRLSVAAWLLVAANLTLFGWLVVGSTFGQLLPVARSPVLGYPAFTAIYMAVHFAMGGAGLVLLAADERRYPERTRALRRGVIVAACASFAFAAWEVAWLSRQFVRPPNVLVLAALFGQAAAAWGYLAAIARRIPSRRAVQWSRTLLIVVLVAMAASVLRGTYWLMLVLFSPWSRPMFAWTLFLLIYPLVAAGTLVYFARTFAQSAVAAEKTWKTESA